MRQIFGFSAFESEQRAQQTTQQALFYQLFVPFSPANGFQDKLESQWSLYLLLKNTKFLVTKCLVSQEQHNLTIVAHVAQSVTKCAASSLSYINL